MSESRSRNHSPAGFLALPGAFVFGLGVSGALLAAAAGWMERQGLSREAAWPLTTAAICIGSFLGGWLSARVQKSRGLLCGAVQGSLMTALLLALQIIQNGMIQEDVFLRCILMVCSGCVGGFAGILRAERRRVAARSL